jgi:4-amino-4-deoxy-L-arabinose transferase-like glycosyltransferase
VARKAPAAKKPLQTFAVEIPTLADGMEWLTRYSFLVFLTVVAAASARIVNTYQVFSHTFDEPAHIACGMEWLDKHVYRYEPQHPPLARVAGAIGPFLAGEKSHGVPGMWPEGLAILYQDGRGERNLALARLGILPFFWIACLVVYLWTKRYAGEPSAALAVLIFSCLPPILAHAGLATTDMPLTAMTGASFLTALIWLDRPSLRNSIVWGLATGLAVLCKFSSLVFIPAAIAAAFVWYCLAEPHPFRDLAATRRTHLRPVGWAASTGLIVIWAGYRFSFGPVPFAPFPLPAPELYAGIQQVIDHNRLGDPAYLLGEYSRFGWWYYYFVVLGVKTPLPFFGLLLCGVVFSGTRRAGNRFRGTWLALAFSLGILVVSLASNINLGVRHVLPVYLGFSVVAGIGAAPLVERFRFFAFAPWVIGCLLVWMVADSVLAHPDYLAYFNPLASGHSEQVLIDSDLDWGQDMKRLAKRLHAVGARDVTLTPFAPSDLAAEGFPPVLPAKPPGSSPGWNALSLTSWKSNRLGQPPELPPWPNQVKPEKIGRGMLLWYVPAK